MYLQALALQNFRSFSHWSHHFTLPVTVILGNNATGKTSVLEAVFLLATGSSFRAQKVDEMIGIGTEYGRVKGKIYSDQDQVELEVLLTRGVVQGKKTRKRLFSVNGVRRQKKRILGLLFTIIFRPEDMRLIEGSKSRRRSFMDVPLSALYPDYAQALKEYEQTLRRRNKLLQSVREREQPQSVLTYWNHNLLRHAQNIQTHRQEFLQFCNTVPFSLPFSVTYTPSLLTQERQLEYLNREIASGHTLIGPHKDDFFVTGPVTKSPDLVAVSTYGSRGQQRLAVLWLKYAELQYLEQRVGQKPVLLLDDIMSELDETSEEFVLKTVGEYQTIITTTEPIVVERVKHKLGIKKVDLVEMH